MCSLSGSAVQIGGVVWLFRYPADTALAVGINLAQVGLHIMDG